MSVEYVSGDESDREGKENTDNIDIDALPSAALVLVLEVQVVVTAGQFHRRRNPAKAPGGVDPVEGSQSSASLVG